MINDIMYFSIAILCIAYLYYDIVIDNKSIKSNQ